MKMGWRLGMILMRPAADVSGLEEVLVIVLER